MKLTVIVNRAGRIVGTMHVPEGGRQTEGAPSEVGVLPQRGQRLYELLVPDEFMQPEHLLKLHTDYRVQVARNEAKLVKYQPRPGRGRRRS